MVQLKGLRVLLTRPEGANQGLQDALEERGCNVQVLPLLEIVPLQRTGLDVNPLADINRYDVVISVSGNASSEAHRYLSTLPRISGGIRWFAMGETSAARLRLTDCPVRYPSTGTDSEALLGLPEMQAVKGQRILILRGKGGREVLAATLRARGAMVDYAELYDRRCPRYDPDRLFQVLGDKAPHLVVLLSGETLSNWAATVRQLAGLTDLSRCTLLVSSERVADSARRLGFESVITLPTVSQAEIINTLADWVQRHNSRRFPGSRSKISDEGNG